MLRVVFTRTCWLCDGHVVSCDPAPIISTLLPAEGPTTGDFKVAVFGLNFVPSANFRITFGSVTASDYEFHSSSSVIWYPPDALVLLCPST